MIILSDTQVTLWGQDDGNMFFNATTYTNNWMTIFLWVHNSQWWWPMVDVTSPLWQERTASTSLTFLLLLQISYSRSPHTQHSSPTRSPTRRKYVIAEARANDPRKDDRPQDINIQHIKENLLAQSGQYRPRVIPQHLENLKTLEK